MSADKAAIDREIAQKRQRLEELKRQRAERAQQHQQSIDIDASKITAAAITLPTTQQQHHVKQQSAEDILNSVSSLISVPIPSSSPKPVTASPSAGSPSLSPSLAKRSLGVSQPQHTDIAPGDAKILYEQSTQTEESKRKKAAAEAAAAAAAAAAAGEASTTSTSTSTSTAPTSIWDTIDEDERDEIIHERDDLRAREVELLKRVRDLTTANESKAAAEEAEKEAALHRELPPAEAEKILSSEEFGTFLDRSSKIVERLLGYESSRGHGAAGMLNALSSRFDYMEDYSASDETGMGQVAGSEGKLTPSIVFAVDGSIGSTLNRPITSIDWSAKYPELLLASYASTAAEESYSDSWLEPDGTVLVWNLHMQKRPEYAFTCQSAIHTAMFHPAHPKLIVGGCENGQLVIWDMRTNKQTPVNRSSLSHGHTHPVFSINIQALNSGLYQIVSVSSDGQVCIWTENNLHQPLHNIQLTTTRSGLSDAGGASVLGSKEDITTTCFDLPARDTNSMIFGSDEGKIYKARIHEQKENERLYETIHAHDAPMTSIEFHPSYKHGASGPAALASDLFLTSSYDWTVKLWSAKLSAKPLFTFESARDYVYSAAWCPSNPYVFASGDGTGKLDVWNLAGTNSVSEEVDVPAVSVQVGASSNAAGGAAGGAIASPTSASASDADPTTLTPLRQNYAISKLKWNTTGSMIACGSSNGSLHLFDVSPDIYTPDQESNDRFLNKIGARMTQNH